MGDSLGDRMKEQYENRTRHMLPRRTYTIVRLDGKAFHTFTASCLKPFDPVLIHLMNETAKKLCEEIQGCRLAFVQSDEISLLLTDFETPTTCAYFDGNIQKIVSVAAAYATAKFNKELSKLDPEVRQRFDHGCALFDARVFTIPDAIEVENYFIWRQQDWTRNSVQMAAQSMYSHKQLQGKNSSQLQDLMMEKGINWNDYPAFFKRGRVVAKMPDPNYSSKGPDDVLLSWQTLNEIPIFTQDREFLRTHIPKYCIVNELQELVEDTAKAQDTDQAWAASERCYDFVHKQRNPDLYKKKAIDLKTEVFCVTTTPLEKPDV